MLLFPALLLNALLDALLDTLLDALFNPLVIVVFTKNTHLGYLLLNGGVHTNVKLVFKSLNLFGGPNGYGKQKIQHL